MAQQDIRRGRKGLEERRKVALKGLERRRGLSKKELCATARQFRNLKLRDVPEKAYESYLKYMDREISRVRTLINVAAQ